jgi:hypothetical protein
MSNDSNVVLSSSGAGLVATITGDPTQAPKPKVDQKNEDAQFVKKQAYEEVSQDMHKFKMRAKEAEARAAEYEARLKAQEEAKLMDEKRFQELYEREKKQREDAERTSKKERELYLRAVKLTALKSELGPVKDEYLTHAEIDKIELNADGSLSSESVRQVANNFRQNHAQLLPTQAGGNITSYASPTSFSPAKPKSLSEMSYAEKAAMLKQLKNK